MAIVNAGQLTVYEQIPPDLLTLVEDVIFDRRPDSTERLVQFANNAKGDTVARGADLAWREAGVNERIAYALVHGVIDYLEADVDEARRSHRRPLDVIEGPLMDGMTRHALTTADIVEITLQIAGALGAAHARSIVHRDIKPGNLLVATTGEMKVVDFGLARRFRSEDTGEMGLEGSTIPGRPLGTANYMAPERILQLPLDPRCDLFSLGVVIYEMATGRLPFAGASPSETVANVLDKDPVPLTGLAPQHPKGLETIVNRLLAKNAGDRYADASALIGALMPLASARGSLSARLRRVFMRH